MTRSRFRRWRSATAALLGAAAAATSVAVLSPAAPARAASGPPVLDQNFADPDVARFGETYHAYATNGDGRNVQHATSSDLGSWTVRGDALPTLGTWASTTCSFPSGGGADRCVWAPDVSATGNGYVMYYTARDRASDKQCIGAATASTPDGPFAPAAAALVCPADLGGAIDPASYVEDGQRYLLWKNDGNCCGQDTWLHLQPVSADGLTLTGDATRLVKQDRSFEGSLVEAPTLWKRGGTYVLLYSANFFGDASYVSSYATATSLSGPYVKAPSPLLTTGTFEGTVRGPGGQDVVTGPDGRDRIVFHGWDPSYTYRAMYVADLGWANDLPVVRGSAVRYEAEDAAVRNAVVRDAPGSTGGRAVARIDFADSRVEFSVYAPRGGTYTLRVRFGNGSQDGASHSLTVNGSGAGEVTYPFTGWDNWSTVDRTVALAEGFNTVTLGRGTAYAELDSLEVV